MSTDTFVGCLRNHRPSGVDSLGRMARILDEELADPFAAGSVEGVAEMMDRLYANPDFQMLLTALRRTISVCGDELVDETLRFTPEERTIPAPEPIAPRPRRTTPGARCRAFRRSELHRALRERGLD